MSVEERLEPWTVRDALILLDKKTGSLTEHFHETQAMVQSFKVSVDNLEQRINNGLSPTMQQVKAQNNEIEKLMIRMEGRMEMVVKDFQSSVGALAGKVMDLEEDRESIKKIARDVVVKVLVAAMIAMGGMFWANWKTNLRVQGMLTNLSDVSRVSSITAKPVRSQ
jgi:chromosome segregation ATPase